MDGDAACALVVLRPEPPDPRHEGGDGIGPVAGGNGFAEPDQGVAAGHPLAVPGTAPAERDLDLHRGLEAVDVGSVKQADLDQAHGPRRIAAAPR
jgi:hypothetical protein